MSHGGLWDSSGVNGVEMCSGALVHCGRVGSDRARETATGEGAAGRLAGGAIHHRRGRGILDDRSSGVVSANVGMNHWV